MNNKKLVLILALLLGIYGISRLFSDSNKSSFDKNLIAVDTALVTKIIINTKSDNFEEVVLLREGSNWLASKGNVHTIAAKTNIDGLLGALKTIRAERVVAKKEDKWQSYEVVEGLGTHVKVYIKDKLEEDFYVGKFDFNQQTRKATTFLRIKDQKEIFSADGFLSMGFGQGFDSFRNKKIVNIVNSNIRQIRMIDKDGDSNRLFTRKGNAWTQDEMPADSTKMFTYINAIAGIQSTKYIDDFDETKADELFHKRLIITGAGLNEPIVVNCYKDDSRPQPFIIHSSQNKGNYFPSDAEGVYKKLFSL